MYITDYTFSRTNLETDLGFIEKILQRIHSPEDLRKVTGKELTALPEEIRERFFDVGIAEEHAIAFADAKTPDRLAPSDKTFLELDIFQAPLGGNSCGPVPLEKYITRADRGTTF